MEREEIETYLVALNAALQDVRIGKPVRLTLVGGVYMIFEVGNRSATKDVDVIPVSFPDTMQANQETKAFRQAVNAVARQFKLKRDWVNDVVAAFVPTTTETTLWREYSHLHISIPSREYILALKLLAGRDKDEDDILALCDLLQITTREQAQSLVDRYADARWQRKCNLQRTLDSLF